jgi:ferrous iron transport protein B
MESDIEAHRFMTDTYPARWTALKYLKKDEQILEKRRSVNPDLSQQLEAIVEKVGKHLEETIDTYPEALIAINDTAISIRL